MKLFDVLCVIMLFQSDSRSRVAVEPGGRGGGDCGAVCWQDEG